MELIFNKLTSLIKKYDKIVLMTHKNPDFDGMGSSIGLQQIIKSFNKESYIIVNEKEKNKSLLKTYKLIKEENLYFNITKDIDIDNYLLIILDTHKLEMVENPNLIKNAKEIVVIDHHIKSKDYIKNTCLNYINANLSSVVEFVTKYIKYLNKTVDPLIATIMLVGLEIDTNNFRLKTTYNTYEAAAFLSYLGANNILKQELLQENIDNYIERQKIIEDTIIMNKNIAMCIANKKIYQTKDLAEIAEELLQFENIQASFVIGKLGKNLIGISARSLGKINVESIMSKLGGGGHISEAATQISDLSIFETQELLKNTISESNLIEK